MKKNLLKTIISCLFLLIVQSVSAQWKWISPSPQGNSLVTSSFVSTTEGWVGGQNGALLKTIDGGQTWTPKYTGFLYDISGVYFSSSTKGYIAQGSYFFETTNSGHSWTVKNYFSGMIIRKMFFMNTDSGWVCGNNAGQEQLLFTVDGGTNWSVQSTPANQINDIQILNTGFGWYACSDGSVYSTINFGINWNSTLIAGNPALNNIQFVDNQNGFVTGDNGNLFKSTDGGATWNPVTNPASSTSIGLKSLYFTNSDSGVIAGTDGLLIQTTDGGTTWNSIGVSGWFIGNRMEGVSANEVFLFGTHGETLHSTDFGLTWNSQQTRITENDLHSIVSLSATNLFSCGDNGIILQSTNSGQAWTLVNSNVGDNLNAITFSNSLNGVAVGNFGQITQTTDGGVTWNSVPSGTGEDLHAVCKMDANTFIAGGTNGTLIISTNGGNTWADSPNLLSGSALTFTSIYFTTPDSGWVTTDNSQVLYTYDGGQNWNVTAIPTGSPISSIYFTNSNNGWLCTGNAEILNTTDAGATWNMNANNYVGSFGKIIFTDALNGWVFGSGQILRTNDGGTTWSDEIDPTINALEDAVFINGTNAIAVGAGLGTILSRTADLHLSLPTADLCTDNNYNLSLTTSGTYNTGNIFTVELSDNNGSYLFPFPIGSVAATGSTLIYISVPGGITPGAGYRLRVVSTDPPSYSPSYSGVLTVHTSPNAYAVPGGPTAFCTGDSVSIYANYDPSWTYQWYKDGVVIPFATSDSIKAFTTGNYTVSVSDGTCSLTSPIVDVLVSTCIGIAELINNNNIYKAFPNPSSKNTTISWPATERVTSISIRDISGRILNVVQLNGSNSYDLDLQTFNGGVYFLSVEGTKPTTIKIVKY